LSRYLDFGFFKMAVATIMDFQNFKFLTVGTVKRVELHHHAKFVKIGQTAAEIWRFFRLLKMAAASAAGRA